MSTNTEALKRMWVEENARADHYQGLAEELHRQLEAFWSGCPSENSSLQEHLLAQWGRERLSRLQKTPALLNGVMQNKVTT